MRWFEQQRQEWIAEMLDIYGFINRSHLIQKFGVSQAQAAIDFRTFQKVNPMVMVYDKSAKHYRKRRALSIDDLGPVDRSSVISTGTRGA